MVNYNNGKIYKIVCDTTGLMYVGSTTKKYLSQRLDQHRSNLKGWKNGNNKSYVTSFKVLENENFKIVLLEPCKCNSLDELKARERVYIETLVCVNKNIPLRTKKEYREATKEHITERNKEYYVANKEQLTEKMKEYNEANKEHIAERMRDYYEANKKQIVETRKAKITCECGSTTTVNHKARHCKSLKHLKYCEGLVNSQGSNPVDILIEI